MRVLMSCLMEMGFSLRLGLVLTEPKLDMNLLTLSLA